MPRKDNDKIERVIYGVWSWTTLEFFYVGQTYRPDKRLFGHIYSTKVGSSRYENMKSRFNNGEEVELVVLEKAVGTSRELIELEVNWWEKLKSLGHPICNAHPRMVWKHHGTMLGRKHTSETKATIGAKNSVALKGKIGANKGRHWDEETRIKMGAKNIDRQPWNKGVPQTDETKQKLSDALKGRSPSNKGVSLTDEQRQKCSDAHKGKPWSDLRRRRFEDKKRKKNGGV
jgi:hypothetical protein